MKSFFLVCISVLLTVLIVEQSFRLFAKPQFFSSEIIQMTTDEMVSPAVLQKMKDFAKRFPKTDPYANIRKKVKSETADRSEIGFGGDIAYGQMKDFRSHLKTLESETTISDVNIHFDQLGRRKTIQSESSNKAKTTLALMGCSWTFGETLQDHQTSASQLVKINPNIRALNLGYSASGMNDIAYHVTEKKAPLFSDVQSPYQIIAFNYIDFQMQRLICPKSCVGKENQWIQKKPYYTLENNQPIYRGTFEEGRKNLNLLYSILNNSAFLNHFKIEIPILFSESDFRLHLALLKKTADALFAQAAVKAKKKDTWLVLLPRTSQKSVKMFKALAPEYGVQIIDLSPYFYDLAYGESTYTPLDLHPTENWNFLHAHMLNEQVEKQLKNWN